MKISLLSLASFANAVTLTPQLRNIYLAFDTAPCKEGEFTIFGEQTFAARYHKDLTQGASKNEINRLPIQLELSIGSDKMSTGITAKVDYHYIDPDEETFENFSFGCMDSLKFANEKFLYIAILYGFNKDVVEWIKVPNTRFDGFRDVGSLGATFEKLNSTDVNGVGLTKLYTTIKGNQTEISGTVSPNYSSASFFVSDIKVPQQIRIGSNGVVSIKFDNSIVKKSATPQLSQLVFQDGGKSFAKIQFYLRASFDRQQDEMPYPTPLALDGAYFDQTPNGPLPFLVTIAKGISGPVRCESSLSTRTTIKCEDTVIAGVSAEAIPSSSKALISIVGNDAKQTLLVGKCLQVQENPRAVLCLCQGFSNDVCGNINVLDGIKQ